MSIVHKVRTALILGTFLCCIALGSGCAGAQKGATQNDLEQEELTNFMTTAEFALNQLSTRTEVAPFTSYLSSAKGVILFPRLYKGSYFFGLEAGQGVLLAHNPDGSWSAPAFVTLSEASFGFQAGGQVSTVILLLMEDEYMQDALTNDLQLSADVSTAIGPTGHSGQINAATHSKGIIYAGYTQGLSFSMAIEGGGIIVNRSRNHAYYGAGVSPDEIVSGTVDNPGTHSLRDALYTLTTNLADGTLNE